MGEQSPAEKERGGESAREEDSERRDRMSDLVRKVLLPGTLAEVIIQLTVISTKLDMFVVHTTCIADV